MVIYVLVTLPGHGCRQRIILLFVIVIVVNAFVMPACGCCPMVGRVVRPALRSCVVSFLCLVFFFLLFFFPSFFVSFNRQSKKTIVGLLFSWVFPCSSPLFPGVPFPMVVCLPVVVDDVPVFGFL